MSLQNVLNALSFYNSATSLWTYPPNTVPGNVSSADIAIFTAAITNLYNNSQTAAGYLDTLAATGAIRISTAPGYGPAAVRPIELGGTGSGNWTVPFLNFPSSDPEIYAVTSFGEIFEMSLETILGHELSHLAAGTGDPSGDTNAEMNDPGYDFVGDTVRNEWWISAELGESDLRANYAAAFHINSSRSSILDFTKDYVPNGYVDIVRFGNLPGEDPEDVIDMSEREDGRSALIFGMSGEDTIDATTEADYVYGGDDLDTIHGHDGNDHLWGEDGDDVVYGDDGDDKIYGGDDNDTLEGGAGADILEGGVGKDILVGGVGADQLMGGDENDLLLSGESASQEYVWNELKGGAGKDVIIANTGSLVTADGGAGADQFWIGKGGQDISSGLEITDPEAVDSLYWNGYKLAGGVTKILDLEQYDDYDYGWYKAGIDSNGVVYMMSGDAPILDIYLPGGGYVTVYNFDNGDLGIYFDSLFDIAHLDVERDADQKIIPGSWSANVAFSNIVLDGIEFNISELDGAAAAINTPGSFIEPISPLL